MAAWECSHSLQLGGGGCPSAARIKSAKKLERSIHMSTLTKWNPFKEMEELQNQLSSLLNGAPVRRHTSNGEDRTIVAAWLPLVDITEDSNEYLVKAELPEVNKENLKVTLENGILTITGERKFVNDEKGTKFHRVERAYGSFARSFSIPDDANASSVKAEFKDGLLTVHIGKDEKAKPQSIEVKIS
jgi:HSP20 family protein